MELTGLGLPALAIEDLLAAIQSVSGFPLQEQWLRLSGHALRGNLPFNVHLRLYEHVFADWDAAAGPPPAWTPDPVQVGSSNLGQLWNDLGLTGYDALHRWSTSERDAFWRIVVEGLGIRFRSPISTIRDPGSPVEAPAWLPGARLNIAESCFQAEADQDAVVVQLPGRPLVRMTYGELEKLSGRVANGLSESEFGSGDAIAVIMPMTLESVAIYLGIVMAGCVVVSISDSFAAEEIASRLELTGARGVFTQDQMHRAGKKIDLYRRVVDSGPAQVIVLPENPELEPDLLRGQDRTWTGFLSPQADFEPVASEPSASTNFLFSSGTTGEPKVIPWTHTTPIKCAADAWLHHDVRPGDVLAWPTNLGWMMGPWLIYAALVNRATIALYPDAPTGRGFGVFIQEAEVTMLGLVPSLVQSWRASGCMEGLDWSRIKAFSSTGECSNPEDMLYLMWLAGYRPIIEYCGGTEIGGAYLTGTVVQPSSPATFSTPALGLDLDLVDEDGVSAESGEVLLIPPSIGLSNTLLNADHHKVYFEGVSPSAGGETRRRHGDEIEAIGGGYYRHHGRADDTMNLGGIKVSSVEIERILNRIPGVRETAAIAVPPAGGGPDRLVIFLVPGPDATETSSGWLPLMQKAVREHLNPLFRVSDVVVVASLPRTASQKIMRRSIRKAYRDEHE